VLGGVDDQHVIGFLALLEQLIMNDNAIKVYNQKTVLSRDLQSGDFFISEEKYVDMKSFTVFPGDLLLTTRGTIGRCVLTPKNAAIGILHPCLMRIQVDSRKVNPSYLELLIQDSNLVIGQLKTMSNATTIDVIYSESLKRVLLLLPPLEEQEKIISFTNKKTEKIKKLMNTIEIAIEKLNELRNSLISAAVTGKIDVRGYAP
jgi:type I restriction enzyme S subunit